MSGKLRYNEIISVIISSCVPVLTDTFYTLIKKKSTGLALGAN